MKYEELVKNNKEFLANIKYFWEEKGDIERFVGFTIEKLERADPVLAKVYKDYKLAEKTIDRLLENLNEG